MNEEHAKLAVISTAEPGYDLALRLLGAGFDVAFHHPELDEQVGRALGEAGVRLAADMQDAVADADVTITLLGGPDEVEDAYMETGGLFESAAAGSYLIDATTSSPRLARELFAIGAVNDLHVLDAPLVYAPFDDDATDPLVSVGGEEEDVAAMQDVLQAMGSGYLHMGGSGKGQLGKLTQEVACASSIMGVVEAVVLAGQSGIEPKRELALLKAQDIHAPAAIHAVERALDGDYDYHIPVEWFVDDLGIALSVADACDLTLPGLESAFQLYDLLTVIGGGWYGPQALMLLYSDEDTCNKAGLDWSKAEEEDLYFGDDYSDEEEAAAADLDYPDTYPGKGHPMPTHRRRGTDESGGMLESFFSPN
jgi:3-hydroxyisobutyrate dehydrogenase